MIFHHDQTSITFSLGIKKWCQYCQINGKGLLELQLNKTTPSSPYPKLTGPAWLPLRMILYTRIHRFPDVIELEFSCHIWWAWTVGYVPSNQLVASFQFVPIWFQVCLSPIQQRIIQVSYSDVLLAAYRVSTPPSFRLLMFRLAWGVHLGLGAYRTLISRYDFQNSFSFYAWYHRKQVVSINTSKRLKELCALVFDSVTPHTDLAKLGEFALRMALCNTDCSIRNRNSRGWSRKNWPGLGMAFCRLCVTHQNDFCRCQLSMLGTWIL